MTVSLSLQIIGSDEEPRWVTDVRPGSGSAPKWQYCCQDGHYTPEAAAAHGSELAAAWLSQAVRGLAAPSWGALVLSKTAA